MVLHKLQVVVSDVGTTIPGVESTEDKLAFLYEACSAAVQVSKTVQHHTSEHIVLTDAKGAAHFVCFPGRSGAREGSNSHSSSRPGRRRAVDQAELGANHMVLPLYHLYATPVTLSCLGDQPAGSGAALHQ